MPAEWKCTQCGECCRTTPYVVVSTEERELLEARGRAVNASWLPDDKPGFWRLLALPCPFYAEGEGCTVYNVRPYNCRRFASLKGYEGSERDGHRVKVLYQRRAQRWADRHGWEPDLPTDTRESRA